MVRKSPRLRRHKSSDDDARRIRSEVATPKRSMSSEGNGAVRSANTPIVEGRKDCSMSVPQLFHHRPTLPSASRSVKDVTTNVEIDKEETMKALSMMQQLETTAHHSLANTPDPSRNEAKVTDKTSRTTQEVLASVAQQKKNVDSSRCEQADTSITKESMASCGGTEKDVKGTAAAPGDVRSSSSKVNESQQLQSYAMTTSAPSATTVGKSSKDTEQTDHHKPNKKQQKKKKNELSKLIPGYTAPLRLVSSSCALGLAELQKRAVQQDAAVRQCATRNVVNKSFKTGRSIQPNHQADATMGPGWFHMRPTPMTVDVQRDLQLIRNRNYLDPKRFYKKQDSNKKHSNNTNVQVGTVVEGAAEYYSSRLTKKQRCGNYLTDQILLGKGDNDNGSSYVLSKYKTMQQEKTLQHKKYERKRRGRR